MNCQVQYCNNNATHRKIECHEIYSKCVVLVKVENELCRQHADLISKTESSMVSIEAI